MNINNKQNIKTIFAIGSFAFIVYIIVATIDAFNQGRFS